MKKRILLKEGVNIEMKSKSRKLLIMISLFGLLIYGIIQSTNSTKTSIDSKDQFTYASVMKETIPHYQLDVEYQEKEQLLNGKMELIFANQTGTTLNEIYFHLFPNAFQNWKWEKENKPQSVGYILIDKVTIDGINTYPHQNGTLLKVNLPKPLDQNKMTRIQMDFKLKLPTKGLRLSAINHTVFLAQWYPMLAVYDHAGWHLDPYTTVGDPFFSTVADFDIKIKLPKGFRVISTAVDPDQNIQQNNEILLSQNKVRDFAMVITKEYEKITAMTKQGIKTNLWYLTGQQEVAPMLLGGALEAMDFYQSYFGQYPMKEIDIVLGNSSYGIAGMEYPGLVTSDPVTKIKDTTVPALDVVAHELAHQWWYSTVGNDQVKEPWLDEGLTTFSEYLYSEKVMKKTNMNAMMNRIKTITDQMATTSKVSVVQSIYSFGDLYGPFVYARPGAMLWNLKNQVGDQKMMQIMQTYYQKYQFKVATTQDFIQTVNQVVGKDMTPFFREWLLINEK
ncbi:M1 family metallopeptidase [Tepidibacillus marianensis]|uniref:M1 family metallopeptidase n=1 Tax=Tepidibacillus marianensis TaxID=3131995 RepID=UPI0030CCA53E